MASATGIDRLRIAASDAIRSQDVLLDAFRSFGRTSSGSDINGGDIELLKQLVLRRILPVNAFELLSKADKGSAIEMLLARYLGRGVDPDRKFGGFVFELASMLDDYYEHHGQDELIALLSHPSVDSSILADPRVKRVLSDILGSLAQVTLNRANTKEQP